MKFSTTFMSSVAAFAVALPAMSETLRIQTHYAPETTSGKLAAEFVEDVNVMSGGDLTIEMFYSSSVVKTVEAFDAAANGILDCDMTGGAYQTGKNPAFQFVGDIMGGYDTPWQQYGWLYHGGGLEPVQKLYNEFNMQLVGWWMYGQEALGSSKPLNTVADLDNFKFRSPPGMETEIFAELGASPIVMDFTEIFTALETGIIDGTDASSLANNVGLGVYDVVKNATYPGFHSMPADHLACRKDKWDGLSDQHKRILDVAMKKLAFETSLTHEANNVEAAVRLKEEGVNISDWSAEDRQAYRDVAQSIWQDWGDRTPEARELVDSHVEYMKKIGLISE